MNKGYLYYSLYEIQMYQHTFFCLVSNRLEEYNNKLGNEEGNVLKNALYESHALHTRNLFEFFRSNKVMHNSNDLLYSDVLGAEYDLMNLEKEYDDRKIYLNKNFAHLSKSRVEEDYIKNNDMQYFIKICYSIPGIQFLGLCMVINEFLNALCKNNANNNLPLSITGEIAEKDTIDFLSCVRKDNTTLLSLKDRFLYVFYKDTDIGWYEII